MQRGYFDNPFISIDNLFFTWIGGATRNTLRFLGPDGGSGQCIRQFIRVFRIAGRCHGDFDGRNPSLRDRRVFWVDIPERSVAQADILAVIEVFLDHPFLLAHGLQRLTSLCIAVVDPFLQRRLFPVGQLV